MVALGMTPMEAIVASTAEAARLIGLQDKIGTIARGYEADLVLFEGSVLAHIDWLLDKRRIAGVMRAGVFVAGPLSRQV